jgi:hypothetical protein
MTISVTGIFQRSSKYERVRPIHIYLLRLLYILMFFVLGRETWTQILTHQGPWDPFKAVAWCVWTAFATLAGLGILRRGYRPLGFQFPITRRLGSLAYTTRGGIRSAWMPLSRLCG